MSVGSVLGITYAHLLASVILVFISSQHKLFSDNIVVFFLVLFVLLALFFVMMSLNPGPLKYILFVIVIVLWGQLLRNRFEKASQKGILDEICFSVLGIFLAMTLVSFMAGDRVLGFGPYLFVALIGLIIGRFVLLGLFVTGATDQSQTQSVSKILSAVGTLLFAGYIAYDTRTLVVSAKRKEKQDYVNNSMNFFLDILNLFSSIEDIME